MDLVRRGVDIGHGGIMIHKVDDGGQELAHVGFQIIRLLPQHGRLYES